MVPCVEMVSREPASALYCGAVAWRWVEHVLLSSVFPGVNHESKPYDPTESRPSRLRGGARQRLEKPVSHRYGTGGHDGGVPEEVSVRRGASDPALLVFPGGPDRPGVSQYWSAKRYSSTPPFTFCMSTIFLGCNDTPHDSIILSLQTGPVFGGQVTGEWITITTGRTVR